MFPTLEKGLLTLSEDEKLLGTLPPGFLYCGCVSPSEPYKGVVRFSGFASKEASGKCDTCGNIQTVFCNGNKEVRDKNGKGLYFLKGDGDTQLWDHIKDGRHAS